MLGCFNIVKKELDKIFKSPRLIFSTFILPGLLIFLIYSVMGSSFTSVSEEEPSIIYVNEEVKSFKDAYDVIPDLNMQIVKNDSVVIEQVKQDIKDAKYFVYIEFEKDFDQKIQDYINGLSGTAPSMQIYYDETSMESSTAYNKILTIVEIMRSSITAENALPINFISLMPVNVATEAEMSTQFFAMLMPIMIIIFIFAGGIAVGSDTIAGEKERGTIATLLMAPINKNQIVLGKIFSTVIITILSGVASFIGLAASMPNMGDMYGTVQSVNYSFITYLELFILIIMVSLIASSVFLLASTLAKSTKEATTYAMPAYIIAMVVSMMTIFDTSMPSNILPYCIPLYNLTIGIKGVLLNQINSLQILLISSSTIVCFIGITFLVTKLFKSEKIMFSK
jgi:sodium transport system permease protein